MTARLIGTFTPGSPEWHAARAGHRLGGSEIGAVLGLSPYESRFSLWHRKQMAIGPLDETPEMEWGKRLEPVILGKYRDQHPELDFDIVNGTFCPDDRPWQIANPDLLAHDRVIDAKFSLYGDGWGTPGTDEVPIHIRCQVLWYCDVVEVDRADLAVLVGGFDYREYTVTYDTVEAAVLREAATEFLTSLAEDERPDIDSHSATYQTIKALHPDIDEAEAQLTNATARTYILAKTAEKRVENLVREATSRVADEMGNAKRAVWDGETVATRQARGEGTPYVVVARNLTDRYPNLKENDVA
jgi:putative phage-type endonuclease